MLLVPQVIGEEIFILKALFLLQVLQTHFKIVFNAIKEELSLCTVLHLLIVIVLIRVMQQSMVVLS